MIIALKEVLVATYGTDADHADEVLSETITLNFARVEVSYQPQKADGGKDGGAIKYGWNIRENIKM